MSRPDFVVVDASFMIGFCAKEADKCAIAQTAIQRYIAEGSQFYAPHLVVMETVFVLCRKSEAGELSQADYAAAITNLQSFMRMVLPPPAGDIALVARAEHLRQGYGCRHSADSLYIALAEELATQGPTELLTFDVGQQKQAARMAPTITVNLLVP